MQNMLIKRFLILIRSESVRKLTFFLILYFISAGLWAQKAVQFSNPGDYIEIPNSPSLSSPQFTFEFWLKILNTGDPDIAGGEQTIADNRDTYGGFNLRLFGTSFPLSMAMVYDTAFTYATGYFSSQTWYHIAITYEDTTKIYINGELIAAKRNIFNSNTSSPLRIGEYMGYPGQYLGLRGIIDEVRLWNFAKSEEDIISAMNSRLLGNESGLLAYWSFDEDEIPLVKDASENHNDGTYYGEKKYITSGAPIGFVTPATPVGLHAISEDNGINLLWKGQNDPNITSYKIFRGTDPEFILDDGSMIADLSGTVNSYLDASAISSQNYFYRIRAMSLSVESNPSHLAYCRVVDSQDDYFTGVYYYPWYGSDYHKWPGEYTRDYFIPEQPPMLGEYSRKDTMVIRQHLNWMEQYGIDFLVSSWWGYDAIEEENVVLRDFIVPALTNSPVKFSVYYELLKDGEPVDGKVEIDDARESIMVADFKYLANTYFNHPNYLSINGRPVVFLYLSKLLSGNYEQAFTMIRNELQNMGYGLFLIGDEMHWGSPIPEHMRILDGISVYSMYGLPVHAGYPLDKDFYGDLSCKNLEWETTGKSENILFIPNVFPSFNDRGIRFATNYASPAQSTFGAEYGSSLEENIKVMKTFVDPGYKMFMITSWNEWHEDTQIEPSIISESTAIDASDNGKFYTQGYEYAGYGMKYLESVQKLLAPSSLTSPPAKINLLYPKDNTIDLDIPVIIGWSASFGATSYELQVSTSSDFSSLVVDESPINLNYCALNGLEDNKTYFWQVRSSNPSGSSDWSDNWRFTTRNASSINGIATNRPVILHSYPNPFSINTTIQFEVSNPSHTGLKIYDVFGREVGTILDKNMLPGSYKIDYKPENLKAGFYILRLVTDYSTNTIGIIYRNYL
jgi:glycoprotein endo-alpha-1,2-mannosidase